MKSHFFLNPIFQSVSDLVGNPVSPVIYSDYDAYHMINAHALHRVFAPVTLITPPFHFLNKVYGRTVSAVNLFRIFEIILSHFDAAICNLLHDVETMHSLC